MPPPLPLTAQVTQMTATTHTIRANVNVSKLLYLWNWRLWSDVSQMLSAQMDFQALLLERGWQKVAQQCNLSQTPDSDFTIWWPLSYKMRTAAGRDWPLQKFALVRLHDSKRNVVQRETLRKVWKIHHHMTGPAVFSCSKGRTLCLRTTVPSVVTVGMWLLKHRPVWRKPRITAINVHNYK